jgi:hypothetical protein
MLRQAILTTELLRFSTPTANYNLLLQLQQKVVFLPHRCDHQHLDWRGDDCFHQKKKPAVTDVDSGQGGATEKTAAYNLLLHMQQKVVGCFSSGEILFGVG